MKSATIRLAVVVLLLGVAASTIGCPQRATLRIDNQSSQDIVEVNSTPVTDDTWGDNLISTPIAPGTSRDITGLRAGDYDARIIFEDDTFQVFFDLVYEAGEIYTLTIEDEGLKGDSAIPSPVDYVEQYVAPTPESAAAADLK